MLVELSPEQRDAITRLNSGCILCSDTGNGKSRTALAYYFVAQGGSIDITGKTSDMKNPKDLYVITTAKKRDSADWADEMIPFRMSPDSNSNHYKNKIVIDSWNNIGKYKNVTDSFFIFDEQRLVGNGPWVDAFLKIAKTNAWILLSATPGDNWMEYIPVFLANGFYKNRTEFLQEHVGYSRYSKYPKVDKYYNTRRLYRLRSRIVIPMNLTKHTIPHYEDVFVDYDVELYTDIKKRRWNVWTNKPIVNASEFCQALRKVVNSDESRMTALIDILEKKKRVIVFYNYDYELDLLKNHSWGDVSVAEWNGHKHQSIPETSSWIYLVQYTAGCEGWNCIETDTVVFWSLNYSYKVMHQAAGRIDRRNTPYEDLYYYTFRSRSSIDLAVYRALSTKKKFNESNFYDGK